MPTRSRFFPPPFPRSYSALALKRRRHSGRYRAQTSPLSTVSVCETIEDDNRTLVDLGEAARDEAATAPCPLRKEDQSWENTSRCWLGDSFNNNHSGLPAAIESSHSFESSPSHMPISRQVLGASTLLGRLSLSYLFTDRISAILSRFPIQKSTKRSRDREWSEPVRRGDKARKNYRKATSCDCIQITRGLSVRCASLKRL